MLLFSYLRNLKKSKYRNTSDADFEESKHPRAKGGANAGQFVKKGTSTGSPSFKSGEETEARKEDSKGKLLVAMRESIEKGETDKQIFEKFSKIFAEKGKTDPEFVKRRIKAFKSFVLKVMKKKGGEKPPPPKPEPDKPEPEKKKPEPEKKPEAGKRKGSDIRTEFLEKSKKVKEEIDTFSHSLYSLQDSIKTIRDKIFDSWKRLSEEEKKNVSYVSMMNENSEYQELNNKESEMQTTRRKMFEKRDKIIHDVLRQPPENIHKKVDVNANDRGNERWTLDNINKLNQFIHKDAFTSADGHILEKVHVNINISYKVKRGNFVPNVYKGSWYVGKINMSNKSERVLYHEFGHQLEHSNPEIRRACQQFLFDRTRGESSQQLSKVSGRHYNKHEMTKKDKFFDAYVGKQYGSGDTEVLSMGLAEIMDNPVTFAEKDPEHFDLICDILQGNIK